MKAKRWFVVGVVTVGIAGLVLAGLWIAGRARQARRLAEVHVQLGRSLSSEQPLGALLLGRLGAPPDGPADPGSDAEILVFNADGMLVTSTADTADASRRLAGTDVLLTELSLGRAASAELVAIDPYVIVADTRAGTSPTADGSATLGTMTTWLESVSATTRTPLAVAADEPSDFAAFVLWLAGELLPSQDYSGMMDTLSEWSLNENVDAGSESRVAALAGSLEPVVGLLSRWRADGVLASNWTDWDRIAVRSALTQAGVALAFAPRSSISELAFDERFHLRTHRLPAGDDRRSYAMLGRAVGVVAGSGPRSDAAAAVAGMLRSEVVQREIEAVTAWSPVTLEGSPLDREHRDVVRWYRGAGDYLVVDEAVANHPVFRRLRTALR